MSEPEFAETPLPEPLMKGRFTLYETPDGGYHIAYVNDGDPISKHVEIPAMVIRMAKMSAEGTLNPLKAIRELMSHGPV